MSVDSVGSNPPTQPSSLRDALVTGGIAIVMVAIPLLAAAFGVRGDTLKGIGALLLIGGCSLSLLYFLMQGESGFAVKENGEWVCKDRPPSEP